MYNDYIIENLKRDDGTATSFYTLYGITDTDKIIIDTDELDTINHLYKMLTDIEYNHMIEDTADAEKMITLELVNMSYEYADTDDEIIIEGVNYPYEITLNDEIPDELSCRVNINGFYYHF